MIDGEWEEDSMQIRFSAALLFALPLFSLPEVYADEISEGRDFFLQRCIACHAFTCNKDGPKLGGLFGRKVAMAKDYDGYTQGLRNSDIVWTGATLDNFFKNPGKLFPESTMATTGFIEDAAQRRKLIAFLETEDPTVNLCPQD
jgi:cytochrome c